MMLATSISVEQPKPKSPGPSKTSASESGNYKSSLNSQSPDNSVQSIELAPFPGATLKMSGFPLWANLSIIGLILFAIIGILLLPRLRNLIGFGDKQEKRLLPGLSLLTVLGFLLGFFLSQSLPFYTSSRTPKLESSSDRINELPTRGNKPPSPPTALYAQSSSKDNGIGLQWKDKSTTEDGFRVERISKDGASNNFTVIAVLAKDADKYFDTAIDPGVAYEYRVASFNLYGSAYSPPAGSIANKERKSTSGGIPLWPWIGATLVASLIACGASFVVVKWFFENNQYLLRGRYMREIDDHISHIISRQLRSRELLDVVSDELNRRRRHGSDY